MATKNNGNMLERTGCLHVFASFPHCTMSTSTSNLLTALRELARSELHITSSGTARDKLTTFHALGEWQGVACMDKPPSCIPEWQAYERKKSSAFSGCNSKKSSRSVIDPWVLMRCDLARKSDQYSISHLRLSSRVCDGIGLGFVRRKKRRLPLLPWQYTQSWTISKTKRAFSCHQVQLLHEAGPQIAKSPSSPLLCAAETDPAG